MEYRILFTGVGRRIELLQAFKNAALNRGVSVKLYGADMLGNAPALAYCDATRRVCSMRDPLYISELLKICKSDKIDLLIPTIDTDLFVLSENAALFESAGTKVLISAPDKIALCRDKNLTSDFFESCGLKAHKTYNNREEYDGPFPCFIKPKDGSSSINAYKVNNYDDLMTLSARVEDYIIQPFIDGTEYTVDILCDYNGKPIHIVPRIRLAVRSGEVLKTEIKRDQKIIDECTRLVESYKPCGPITVQLIRQKGTDDDYYIEINPRFGGGAPLSMKAGANSALAVLKLIKGERVEYSDVFSDGAVYSRFDQSVCTNRGASNLIRGVIFDLDDTLYSEKQYVKSGYRAVALALGNAKYADMMWEYFENGYAAIDKLLSDIGQEDRKDECVNIYREHMPTIELFPDVKRIIERLREADIKVGIITDGRVSGQRNKIQALGLDSLVDDVIITDELGGTQFRKPNDISFRIMQLKWRIPFEELLYVGDNAGKDFQAPRQLGMDYRRVVNRDGVYFGAEAYDFDIESISDIERIVLDY